MFIQIDPQKRKISMDEWNPWTQGYIVHKLSSKGKMKQGTSVQSLRRDETWVKMKQGTSVQNLRRDETWVKVKMKQGTSVQSLRRDETWVKMK